MKREKINPLELLFKIWYMATPFLVLIIATVIKVTENLNIGLAICAVLLLSVAYLFNKKYELKINAN